MIVRDDNDCYSFFDTLFLQRLIFVYVSRVFPNYLSLHYELELQVCLSFIQIEISIISLAVLGDTQFLNLPHKIEYQRRFFNLLLTYWFMFLVHQHYL